MYDYLMEQINRSATKYLTKLAAGELDVAYSVEDYLTGNYTVTKPAPAPGAEEDGPKEKGGMDHFAGPGVSLGGAPGPDGPDDLPPEPPTLGDLVSRPPKGTPPMPAFEPATMEVPGDDKSAWLTWDGEKASVKDLDTYILSHYRRMKPCTSFDTFTNNSGENRVFGGTTPETHYKHFDVYVPGVLDALKDEFPEEASKYAADWSGVTEDAAQLEMKRLYNPFGYVAKGDEADVASRVRIRVGGQDADTSLSVSMTLACLTAQNGIPTDYAIVWDLPHCEADYKGEVVDWIHSFTLA